MNIGHNNPEKSSRSKKYEQAHFGFSMFTYFSFDATKNELDCHRGIDCMERFCKDLNEHATKIINYGKKEMIPLTYKENKSYKKQNLCYICKKGLGTDDDDDKKYHKIRDHCHYTGKCRGAAHRTCNLRYKTPKEISITFHNGSTCDYHFIIKKLAKKCEGQFDCLGGNTEKNILLFQYQLKKTLIMAKNYIQNKVYWWL